MSEKTCKTCKHRNAESKCYAIKFSSIFTRDLRHGAPPIGLKSEFHPVVPDDFGCIHHEPKEDAR